MFFTFLHNFAGKVTHIQIGKGPEHADSAVGLASGHRFTGRLQQGTEQPRQAKGPWYRPGPWQRPEPAEIAIPGRPK